MKALDFNFDLNLVQSQKILLTPQLKQALEILRMTSQELFEYVEEELEKNPILEALESEGYMGEETEIDNRDELEWDSQAGYRGSSIDTDERCFFRVSDFTVDKATVGLSLKEHLVFQLHTSALTGEQIVIGEYLVDNIDENGYIAIDLSEAASYYNVPASKIKKVLDHIQSFDPPGICARNLKECLLIQLRQMNCKDPIVRRVVENHLDDLAANRISRVAKNVGTDIKKINEVFELIRTLEPIPGRAFGDGEEVKYIIPDITVRKMADKFDIAVNDDSIPLIGINEYYKGFLSQDLNTEARKYMQSKLDNARWLIKCLEQRRNTLRKVAGEIVGRQAEFFGKGVKYLKPLTMKEIAGKIDMHESTVSRAISGKYLQCPWGVFEMRYFFSGKLFSGKVKKQK